MSQKLQSRPTNTRQIELTTRLAANRPCLRCRPWIRFANWWWSPCTSRLRWRTRMLMTGLSHRFTATLTLAITNTWLKSGSSQSKPRQNQRNLPRWKVWLTHSSTSITWTRKILKFSVKWNVNTASLHFATRQPRIVTRRCSQSCTRKRRQRLKCYNKIWCDLTSQIAFFSPITRKSLRKMLPSFWSDHSAFTMLGLKLYASLN